MKKNYLHERKAHLPFVLALGLIAAPIPALAETEAPHADAVATVNQQKVTISGIVKDEAGEPIIGASVIEKGNAMNGVITDLDGRFSLSLSGNAVDISYVGYKTQTINLKPGVREYNVVLHEDTEMLDEVVVVGYGVQKFCCFCGFQGTGYPSGFQRICCLGRTDAGCNRYSVLRCSGFSDQFDHYPW
jgi:hypothetical protein